MFFRFIVNSWIETLVGNGILQVLCLDQRSFSKVSVFVESHNRQSFFAVDLLGWSKFRGNIFFSYHRRKIILCQVWMNKSWVDLSTQKKILWYRIPFCDISTYPTSLVPTLILSRPRSTSYKIPWSSSLSMSIRRTTWLTKFRVWHIAWKSSHPRWISWDMGNW